MKLEVCKECDKENEQTVRLCLVERGGEVIVRAVDESGRFDANLIAFNSLGVMRRIRAVDAAYSWDCPFKTDTEGRIEIEEN